MVTCSALGVFLLLEAPGISSDKKLVSVSPPSVEAGHQSLSAVRGLGEQSLGRERSLWDHPQRFSLLKSPRSQNTVPASPLPTPGQKSRIRVRPKPHPRHRSLCALLDKGRGLLPAPLGAGGVPGMADAPASFLSLTLKLSSGWTCWKILVFTINVIYITSFWGGCFLFCYFPPFVFQR